MSQFGTLFGVAIDATYSCHLPLHPDSCITRFVISPIATSPANANDRTIIAYTVKALALSTLDALEDLNVHCLPDICLAGRSFKLLGLHTGVRNHYERHWGSSRRRNRCRHVYAPTDTQVRLPKVPHLRLSPFQSVM